MTRAYFHQKAHLILLFCIAFCLPLAFLTPVFISLLFLNWIIEGELKQKFKNIFASKMCWLFLSVYFFHVLAMSFTANEHAGFFDLQVKLSLLIFPIILASKQFDFSQFYKLMRFFILGALVASILLVTRAVFLYFTRGENNFFYQAFSVLLHPSYFAMYLDFIIAYLLIQHTIYVNTKNISKTLSLFLLIYFTIIILLLSSKMGFLVTIFIYLFFGILIMYQSRKWLSGIIVFISLSLLMLITFKYIPQTKGRINGAIDALTTTTINNADAESTAVRLLIWKAAGKIISDNLWIGVGTGDAKDELLKEYANRGMTGAIEHDLNAHNEFFQLFVAVGVFGFALFFASLLIPFIIQFKNKNWLYCNFIFIILFNILVESMFETQAGTMFYGFFNSLLFFSISTNIKHQSTITKT